MSRVAKIPVTIPAGVEVSVSGTTVKVKGKKGELSRAFHPAVTISQDGGQLKFKAEGAERSARALAGTARALVQNMVRGVTGGYEQKLEIVGVGYRAAVQGKSLNLTLGYSHPLQLAIPPGLTVETPSQTEVIVKGVDRQMVGQFAAEIRSYRTPEPYKGKGVKYADEHIIRKEAKKA